MASSRTSLASLPERISVLETRVDNIEDKIDDLKADVKEMHDCLDITRDVLAAQLKAMSCESVRQHDDLGEKIKNLEQFRQKWVYLSAGGIAALGWVTAHSETLIGLFK